MLVEPATREEVLDLVHSHDVFSIGCSWGGAHDRATPHLDLAPTHGHLCGHRLARLSIEPESLHDLIDDLARALQQAGLSDPQHGRPPSVQERWLH